MKTKMKSIYVIGFVLNLVIIVSAFKFVGLALVLALSIGVYKFISTKFEGKSKLAEKMMFAVPYLTGPFAIQYLFQDSFITLIITIVSFVVFLVFSNAE